MILRRNDNDLHKENMNMVLYERNLNKKVGKKVDKKVGKKVDNPGLPGASFIHEPEKVFSKPPEP